jgi:hypothetical protein
MQIVASYFSAVIMCIITMICWGSWANTMKLTRKGWVFQLYYWDYSIGVVLFSFYHDSIFFSHLNQLPDTASQVPVILI